MTGPTLLSNIVPILSIEEEGTMQQKNLLDLLKMAVFKDDCWYAQLKTMLGNPLEPPASSISECNTSCPKYCDEVKHFVLPVKRSVLSVFLSDTFINNLSGQITPEIFVQKLYVYPEVGKIIYNQARSNNASALMLVTVTVLQLIASELIRLNFDEDNICYCRLNVTDLIPAYLDESIWGLLSMVD
mmetsp:Transcript_20373/g.19596  ORF Transcript_20373/g.19596 Transcript_20373/m.19596 type:complete len:186 (-) Transcript_20373:60-617(-)